MYQSMEKYGFLLLMIFILSVGSALAAPSLGDLDATFNASGILPGTLLTPIGTGSDNATAIAVQPDGKIVVAGQVTTASGDNSALVRYNVDGSLDTSFNGTGIVTTVLVNPSLVLQPDGKIVEAGSVSNTGNYDFALERFNTDGSLDTSFGTAGKVMTDLGSVQDDAGGIALQADGKLVVSGYRDNGAGGFDYVLVRYNADGTLDNSFGTGGIVISSLGNTNDWGVTLTLQPDGKIIIASGFSSPDADFFLARYTKDGALDTTFNPGSSLAAGTVTTNTSTNFLDTATSVLVQPDGKIVAVGRSGQITVVRYNADGSLDTSFGAGGVLLYDPGSSGAYAVALEPNGKIVVAGSMTGTVGEFAVVRFNPDGTLDGVHMVPVGASSSHITAIAVEPDGKFVAAGIASNGTDNDFAVARYVSNDAPWDTTPDAFSFSDVTGAGVNSLQTSGLVTITGLDTATSVPVTVSGGEYAINGSTTYTTDPAWVKNGDILNVRATAASAGGQTTNTILTVGGIIPSNNLALVLGTTTSDTYSVTTATSSGSSGLIDPRWLIFWIASLLWFRCGAKRSSI